MLKKVHESMLSTTQILHINKNIKKTFEFLYIVLCINYRSFNAYVYIYKEKQCHVCFAAHWTTRLRASDQRVRHLYIFPVNIITGNMRLIILHIFILTIDKFARFTWNIEKSSQFITPPGAAILDSEEVLRDEGVQMLPTLYLLQKMSSLTRTK